MLCATALRGYCPCCVLRPYEATAHVVCYGLTRLLPVRATAQLGYSEVTAFIAAARCSVIDGVQERSAVCNTMCITVCSIVQCAVQCNVQYSDSSLHCSVVQ